MSTSRDGSQLAPVRSKPINRTWHNGGLEAFQSRWDPLTVELMRKRGSCDASVDGGDPEGLSRFPRLSLRSTTQSETSSHSDDANSGSTDVVQGSKRDRQVFSFVLPWLAISYCRQQADGEELAGPSQTPLRSLGRRLPRLRHPAEECKRGQSSRPDSKEVVSTSGILMHNSILVMLCANQTIFLLQVDQVSITISATANS